MTKQQVYAIYITRHILANYRHDVTSLPQMFAMSDSGDPDSPTVEVRGERLQRMLDMEVEDLCR